MRSCLCLTSLMMSVTLLFMMPIWMVCLILHMPMVIRIIH